MAMARRLLITALATPFTRQFWCKNNRGITNLTMRTPRTISSTLCGVNSFCSKAASNVSVCAEDELKHETLSQRKLTSVKGFKLSTKGSVATFTKVHEDEVITVSLDANKLETMSDYLDEEEEESLDDLGFDDSPVEEETFENEALSQIFYPTSLIISIKKPSGDRIQFQCSTECLSDEDPYMGDLIIDSMCYVPSKMSDNEVYQVNNIQVGDDLLNSLYDYLSSRGINGKFVKDILLFTQTFRTNLYINDFVKKLKTFM